MRKIISKVASRLYGFATGIPANYLREIHEDTEGSISALERLIDEQGVTVEVENWPHVFRDCNKDCEDLAQLFNKYGSDKADKHNYYMAYSSILAGKRHQRIKIFEMGLGTNDPTVKSTMGVEGKPGASLRAFAEWAPGAQVYGADIDRKTLFHEERIKTYYADQTDPGSLYKLADKLPKDFDLVIDDGLHTPWANFNTVRFGLSLLKPDGVLVVEDILDRYLSLWRIAVYILSAKYDCKLVRMKAETICVIKRKS